jgi:hypothetical protein
MLLWRCVTPTVQMCASVILAIKNQILHTHIYIYMKGLVNCHAYNLIRWSINLPDSKVKLTFSLFLINLAPHNEDVWVRGGIAPLFLISALDGGEWSASRPCHFTPEETVRGIHWEMRVSVPQSQSGRFGERNFFPLQGIEPQFLDRPAHSPSLYH